ncbi:MAG: substrate-binding domain-containing protein [Opitutales bacterium]
MNKKRVAVVLSAVNVQRLLPGIQSFVETGRDYWMVDIYRPWEDLERLLRRWSPTGLITEWISPITEKLLALELPTVVAPCDLALGPGRVACVDVDDDAIGCRAADYFARLGVPHLAYLGNRTNYSEQRGRAFAARGAELGFEVQSHLHAHRRPRQYIEHWPASSADLIEWIRRLPRPCGLFVAHDPLARTVAEASRDAGVTIPRDLAILGVNDDPLVCNMTNPKLSSIGIPWTRIGFEVGARMEALLATPGRTDWPPIVLSPSEPVTRHSSDRSSTDNPRLQRVLEHIREHACEGLRVEDVARRCHLPRRTLERLFREELGCSPRDEILRHRIERAQRLLSETDLSMPLVAERSGFSNAAVFSLNFRRLQSETPSSYRRRFRSEPRAGEWVASRAPHTAS